MGGWFNKLEKWWERPYGFSPFLLEFAVAWIFTGIANEALSRFGPGITSPWLVTAMHYIREYIFNVYVGIGLGGLLLGAFGPLLAMWLKPLTPLFRALVPLVGLIALAFVGPVVIDWWGARNDPKLFEPTARMKAVAHKTKMGIVDKEPSALTELYRANTSIQANRLVQPYIGEWMPISGKVYDIDTPTDNVNLDVWLDGAKTMALLNFDDKNRGPYGP